MLGAFRSTLLTISIAVVVFGHPCGLYVLLDRLLSLIPIRTICCSLIFLLFLFARRIHIQFQNSQSEVEDQKGSDNIIYGLGHGRLNIALPPPTMWMNMGYWEVRLSLNQPLLQKSREYCVQTSICDSC